MYWNSEFGVSKGYVYIYGYEYAYTYLCDWIYLDR